MTDTAFVSMPFADNPDSLEDEWTKLFEYGLRPLEEKMDGLPENIEHVPIKLWRADRNLESLSLKLNVIRGIEQATFMICVLTASVIDGKNGNRMTSPNVEWELGFADALGKPIIAMADNPKFSELPILTGFPNIFIYDHKLVQNTNENDAPEKLLHIAKSLAPWLLKASEEARKGNLLRKRTRAIAYSNRDVVDLNSMISSAKTQVDILTTNLNYFLFDKLNESTNPFSDALKNGAIVRVVTMNPESVIAEYRAKQLVRGQDIPGYRRELRDGIINLYKQFDGHPQFHLHVYNDLPLQITFRIDEQILTSIVTRGERARKRIHIKFSLYDEGVTESFVSHFQSMFDNSEDVRGLRWVTEKCAKKKKNKKVKKTPAGRKRNAGKKGKGE